jgi:hypothetical protein
MTVTRIILISVFGVLLAACSTEMPAQTASTRERLACADVGIGRGSPAFAQCAATLDASLLDEQGLDH